MAESEQDQDVYVTQLREVFDECDGSGTGYLSRSEVRTLCRRLQLTQQTDHLVQHILPGDDPDARVDFDEFKEGFVLVLAQVEGGGASSSEDEDDGNPKSVEMSPKYVRGEKKYGRRSRPELGVGEEESGGEDDIFTDRSEGSASATSARVLAKRLSTLSSGASEEGDVSSSSDYKRRRRSGEMYEAEGQVNASLTPYEEAMDPVSEEEHLRAIWQELKVGEGGGLVREELRLVCQHIGMEQMDDEELEHLFLRLDSDGDGRVSFHEFLQGLFQHGGATSPPKSATPVRPLSAQRRQQLSLPPEARTITPSLLAQQHSSGIFVALDPANTGFATSEKILQLWENLGIMNGGEILEALGFEMETKVGLQELSVILEQELFAVEEDNAIYQVAIATYQHELRHFRSHLEVVLAERDKLRVDLLEAGSRSSRLLSESDDRHVLLEEAQKTQLKEVERKHLEQVRALQAEREKEREGMTSQLTRLRQQGEEESGALKQEMSGLRDQVNTLQKENETLDIELSETVEDVESVRRENGRLKKDLDGASQLQQKLAEMESSQELLSDERERFAQHRLQQLKEDNKDLRDRVDELTLEVESLRQAASRKRGGRRRQDGGGGGSHEGSRLSDYNRSHGSKKAASEEEDTMSGSRTRRRLPRVVGDMSDDASVRESQRLASELETLKETTSKRIEELRAELEQAQADLLREREQGVERVRKRDEERSEAVEAERLLAQKRLDGEKELWRSELEGVRTSVEQQLKETANTGRRQLESARETHRQELAHLEDKLARQKVTLTERLSAEHASEVESQLATLRQDHATQLATLQPKTNDSLLQQLQTTNEQLRRQISELEASLSAESVAREAAVEEREKLQRRLSQAQRAQQTTSVKAEDRSSEAEIERQVAARVETKLRAEREAWEDKLTMEKRELADEYDSEKARLLEEHGREVAMVRAQAAAEKDALEEVLTASLTQQIQREVRSELEAVRQNHEVTRQQLQREVNKLKAELKVARDEKRSSRAQSRAQSRESLLDDTAKSDRLGAVTDSLAQAKERAEALNEQLREKLSSMTEDYAALSAQFDERLRTAQAHKEDLLSASRGLAGQKGWDVKTTIAELKAENQRLEEEVGSLRQELSRLQARLSHTDSLQTKIQDVEKERAETQVALEKAKDQLLAHQTSSAVDGSAQAREVAALREQVQMAVSREQHQKLEEESTRLTGLVQQLRQALKDRSQQTSRLVTETQLEQRRRLMGAEEERDDLGRKLEATTALLAEQMRRHNLQLERLGGRAELIKDLYVENAGLVKALQVREAGQRRAERDGGCLNDKYMTLRAVLKTGGY